MGRPRRAPILDGADELRAFATAAGYTSLAAAVTAHALFIHPDTVAQTRGEPLFRIIRHPALRGQHDWDRRLVLDDNSTPVRILVWTTGATYQGPENQVNHVWRSRAEPATYTAPWNLVATPEFLAKTTDGTTYPDVRAAIEYRAWELYGTHPADVITPRKPAGFERLVWRATAPPVFDLEVTLRACMARAPRSRAAVSARTFGWLFSAWEPDSRL